MRFISLFSLLLSCITFLFHAPQADARSHVSAHKSSYGRLITTLSNGMKVAIINDPLAPVIQVMINYHVGSAQSPQGKPGTAHALEHMMFNGTSNLSRDQLAVISARLGDMDNADTTPDMTQYYFEIPAHDLDTVLRVEADRMHALNITPKEWRHERGAIEQEVSRDLSDPIYRYASQLRAILFKGTPYERDALGDRKSFDATSTKDLRAFYHDWYTPNNATLVIAGDIDPQEALRLTEKHFSAIPAVSAPQTPKVSPGALKAQTLQLKTDLPISLAAFAWRWPGQTSKDYAAAEILADILSNDRGALESLGPDGKALEAGFSYSADEQAGTAIAFIGYPKQDSQQKYANLLNSVLHKMADGHFSKSDIRDAKTHEIASLSFSQNSIAGLAELWSETLVTQHLNSPDELIKAFKSVSRKDLQRLARNLLKDNEKVTAFLTPSGKIAAIGGRAANAPESLTAAPKTTTVLPKWAKEALGKPSLPPKTKTPVSFTLANGLKVIVQQEHVSPTIQLEGFIKQTPELVEPKGKEGVAALVDQMFIYGSKSHDRIELSRLLDAISAEEQAGSTFALSVLKKDFSKGLKLLADHELHPAFPEKSFLVARKQFAQAQAGLITSPEYHLKRTFKKALLPKNDPSLRKTTPSTIQSISMDDLNAFFAANYRPDMTTIFVIGDIKPEIAKKKIEAAFGEWTAHGAKPPFHLPAVPLNKTSRSFVPDPGRSQDETHLVEMLPIKLTDTAHFDLNVGNEVLGSGFSSRLLKELRVKTGYAYSASSSLNFTPTRSTLSVNFGTDPDKLNKAVNKAKELVQGLRLHPLSNYDIEIAKAGLLRRQVLSKASFSSIARNYLWIDEMDLQMDYPDFAAKRIYASTPRSVQAAFRQFIDPSRLAQVTYGPRP